MTNGSVVISWVAYSHGFGRDQIHFTLEDAEMSWKARSSSNPPSTHPSILHLLLIITRTHQLMAPGSIVRFGSTTAIRVSMTLFYRHFFHPVKTFMRVSAGAIALKVVIYLTIIIGYLVICRPMRYASFPEGPGHCGDIHTFQSYTSVSAIVLDVITVALPMPLVWGLATSTRRKWGLSVIFGLGVLYVRTFLNCSCFSAREVGNVQLILVMWCPASASSQSSA
jgi:hypothetical protein